MSTSTGRPVSPSRCSDDPALDVGRTDLGMKLDAPGGVADAERLDAHGRAGEHGRVRRRPALVAVPLERIESRRERPDAADRQRRRRSPRPRTSRSRPPGRAALPARGRGEQLGPQTDAEQGRAALEHARSAALVSSPIQRCAFALVDVHRAAERHHRVVAHGIGGRRVGLDAETTRRARHPRQRSPRRRRPARRRAHG